LQSATRRVAENYAFVRRYGAFGYYSDDGYLHWPGLGVQYKYHAQNDRNAGRLDICLLRIPYEEHLHHYLLHYYLLTSVAGCSFTFQLNAELGKPAGKTRA
jgi:hypothetical protein